MGNQIKSILLLGVLGALLVGLGALVAPGQLWLFGVLAMVMNLGAYFFSDRIVLAMSRAQEVPVERAPGLHRIVEELAGAAGIPRPRVYVIPEEQPNAFATGRNPSRGVVAVTEGIVRLLSERELRGVLAHELAHIRNRDILLASIAAAVASVVTWIAHALGMQSLFGRHDDEEGEGSGLAGLAMMFVAPLAATVVQLAISRSREYLADETGARISGDPDALADALAKLEAAAHAVPAQVQPATASLYIVSPLAGAGSVLRLFSTHPPMKERIRRLRLISTGAWGATARGW